MPRRFISVPLERMVRARLTTEKNMELGFKEWAEKRGVWPRLTHEEIWDTAVKTERESCAKICDELKSMDYCVDVRQAADAIRKRSNDATNRMAATPRQQENANDE